MTSPAVVNYPPHQIISMLPEENLEHYEQVSGITVASNSVAIMRVKDPTGRFICRQWTAEPNTDTNTFVWDIPYDDLEYIQHGSRYTIFIVVDPLNATSKRKFIRHGLLIWVGR